MQLGCAACLERELLKDDETAKKHSHAHDSLAHRSTSHTTIEALPPDTQQRCLTCNTHLHHETYILCPWTHPVCDCVIGKDILTCIESSAMRYPSVRSCIHPCG
jgi:hypothetical protein